MELLSELPPTELLGEMLLEKVLNDTTEPKTELLKGGEETVELLEGAFDEGARVEPELPEDDEMGELA